MDPGGQGNPYPQNKNRPETNPPFRPCRGLDSSRPRGFRESRDYNGSGSCYDYRSLHRGLADTYRTRPGGDSYKLLLTFRLYLTWDSYRLDSSQFVNSLAATNQPVTSRAEDPVSSGAPSVAGKFATPLALVEFTNGLGADSLVLVAREPPMNRV